MGLCVAVAMSQDGNCLFSAIVHQLDNNMPVESERFVQAASNLRKQAVAVAVWDNLPTFSGSITIAISDMQDDVKYNPEDCDASLYT